MSHRVQLVYFRPTGKYLACAEAVFAHDEISKIWAEVRELRRLGRLPGLRPNAGREVFVLVDAIDHPRGELHLVVPSSLDEDDVTILRGLFGAT